MLAEMDEEFGVGDLLSELMTEDKAKVLFSLSTFKCDLLKCDSHSLAFHRYMGHMTCEGSGLSMTCLLLRMGWTSHWSSRIQASALI